MRVKNLLILVFSLMIVFCAVEARANLFPAKDRYTDKEIEKSIKSAVKYLISKQNKDGSWGAFGDPNGGHYYPTGPTALIAYALMESGMKITDEPVKKALDFLIKKASADPMVYSVGLRCCCLDIASRQYRAASKKIKRHADRVKYLKADKYTAQLRQDCGLLIRTAPMGFYSYKCDLDQPFKHHFDQSNSQYGLLGVWAATNNKRYEISSRYWKVVLNHWVKTQCSDGGWSYYDPKKKPAGATNAEEYESKISMTCAGLASLFVCIDKLYTKEFSKCKGDIPELKALNKGLDWFCKNFKADYGSNKHFRKFYSLYGVERVALASGLKFFGKYDWYKTGASWLLAQQKKSGLYGHENNEACVNAAYAVLFLVRGRNPVLINKLKFNSDWNNRPRDVAALAKYVGKKYETTVNFQIVTLESDPAEWHDAPFLYISGSKDPNFTDADIKKLRDYVLQGGVIISSTECHGRKFKKAIREAYKKMFPRYELQKCRRKHPLYSMFPEKYTKSGKPVFYCMSNFVRPIVLHTDEDLSLHWQMRNTRGANKRYFDIFSNIMGYCNQIARKMKKRGQSSWPDVKDYPTDKSIDIVRVKFAGVCNPEPLAWERMRLLLAKNEKVKVNYSEIDMKDLASCKAQIALISGTSSVKFKKAQRKALKKFINAGGTVIIDPVGGNKSFVKSIDKLLKKLYKTKGKRISYNKKLFKLKGHEITKKDMRVHIAGSYSRSRKNPMRLIKVGKDKRPAIYICTIDLTFGLLGARSNTVTGLAPEAAYKIARNIVLLTLQQKEKKK